jgi:hypothetical protein
MLKTLRLLVSEALFASARLVLQGVSTGAVAPSLRAHREEFMPARQSRVLMYCHVLEFQIDSPLPDKMAHDLRQMTVRVGMTYLGGCRDSGLYWLLRFGVLVGTDRHSELRFRDLA